MLKHEGKRPFDRPWHRWQNNTDNNIKNYNGRACIGLICLTMEQTADCFGHSNQLLDSIKHG
jgi:hypothetical protein